MITIKKNQTSTVKLFLNHQKVNEAESVQLRLNSPTRSAITLDKSLSQIGLGFYSLEVYLEESYLLKDDTYSYQILQNGVISRRGNPVFSERSISNILLENTFYQGYWNYTDKNLMKK